MISTLLPYQRKGVDRIKDFEGLCIIADEMGLGKTVQCLAYASETGNFPMLAVCPASLKANWAGEVKKHLGLTADVLNGRTESGKKSKPADVSVINYEILEARLDELLRNKYKLIVPDEGHYLQSRAAKRTKAARKLCRKSPHVIVATGTPITNRPSELWSLLNLVRQDLFPSFHSYASEFCKIKKTPWGWDYSGSKNLDKLHLLLKENLMVRRLKSDVMKDLPPKRTVIVPLDIEDRKQYDGAKRDFVAWVIKNRPHKLAGAVRAQGLQKANRLKQLAGRLKFKNVCGWADEFLASSGGKLIIYAYHTDVVEKLYARYKAISVCVHGAVAKEKRQPLFDSFNNDPRVRVFVGQIRAAGQGWSCISASDTAFAELDWSPAAHSQAEARTHGHSRGVAGRVSTAYYLTASGTCEEQLLQLLDKKTKDASAALDGRESDEDDLFSLFCDAMIRN